ncbi:MAG TPA: glycosyltransferase, partial [Candidatus Limnocylindrales bacterium]|nr:glycosyltransferase [Candidatus Limnocylindrales bacterium]
MERRPGRPELSVVIPTHGRPRFLGACLDALAAQDTPPGAFEVIVSIDGPDAATDRLLGQGRWPFSPIVVRGDRGGAGAARNRGAAMAQGRILLFLDDDMVAAPGLVGAHLRAHASDEGRPALVIGWIDLLAGGGEAREPLAAAYRRAWQRHHERLAAAARPLDPTDAYGGNLSVPCQAFRDVGGFTTDLSSVEDVELATRLATAGAAILFAANAIARHDDPKNSARFLADAEREGAAGLELWRRHPTLLAHLELGRWVERRPAARGALRLALATGLSPAAAARLTTAARPLFVGRRGSAWADRLFAYLRTVAAWRGLRNAPGGRAAFRALTRGLPVLMYHGLAAPGEVPSRYVLGEAELAAQLRWLRRGGWRSATLSEVADGLAAGRPVPERTVVLTFDD